MREGAVVQQSSSYVIAVLAAGLIAGAVPLAAVPQDRDFGEEQVDRQTRTFDLGASGFLDLANVTGDITVTAGPGSRAEVEIVRRSRGRTAADVRRGLDEVTVEIVEERGGARLRARYPERQGRTPYSVSVAYVVTAPAGTRLTANSVVGDVTARGIEGDVSVDVISGSIDVRGVRASLVAKAVSGDVTVADVRTDAAVEVTSINGDITLRDIQGGGLRVNTVAGSVRVLDARVTSADLKSMAGDVTYQGSLAAGGRYDLQAHSGDVEIVVDGAAEFDFDARTFSGDITPDANLALTNVSATRRTLRGRAGGGGAALSATTFSGDVVIRRR
jgi:DUF4097 and DUF4098 domain-containing protein YvlB